MKLSYKENIDYEIELSLYVKSLDKKSIFIRKAIIASFIILVLSIFDYFLYNSNIPVTVISSFSLFMFYLLFILVNYIINKICEKKIISNLEDYNGFLFNEDIVIDLTDETITITEGNNSVVYSTNESEIYYIDKDKVFLKLNNDKFIYIPRSIFINNDHFEVFLDMLDFAEIEVFNND